MVRLPSAVWKRLRRVWRPEPTATHGAWEIIDRGPARGYSIYVNKALGHWHLAMANGEYDATLYDALDPQKLAGQVVFDVGAHIGYHTLCLSAIVGPKGSVVAVEPNPVNRDRLTENVKRNLPRTSNVQVCAEAVSDRVTSGVEFSFSDQIDTGLSTGSHLEGAPAPLSDKAYLEAGFRKERVPTTTLDELADRYGKPALVKLDIEGAEGMALRGAKRTLADGAPAMLVEVHSTRAMYDVMLVMHVAQYDPRLLESTPDGRCFLSCTTVHRERGG